MNRPRERIDGLAEEAVKLSEALVQRATITKRVQELRSRLTGSAVVQEGEQPPENPQELFAELDRLFVQLADLIARINRTNLTAKLTGGETLTNALARRDVLRSRSEIVRAVAEAATAPGDRYSRTEIKKVPTVDIAALRKQADALSQEYRELDFAIQEANWATELIDA